MWTYMTLDGDVLDLTRISAREQAYLEQCQVAYRAGTRGSNSRCWRR